MEGGEEGGREEGVQRTAGKRGCPKLSCELNGRDVMDAKQLSSGRSQVSAVSRSPSQPPSHLPLFPVSAQASTLTEISLETFPRGKRPRKTTCSLSHTHTHFYQ